MKKWKSLPGILIIMMAGNANAQLILERTFQLHNYPSGSSIEFVNNKFYVVGDDATHLMILNPNYGRVDSARLFKGDNRISKNKKTDLESSTVVTRNGNQSLLLLGSSSTPKRKQLTVYPLYQSKTIESFSVKRFNKRLYSAGLKELNFEGFTSTEQHLIIANRGHLANPTNQFIVTDLNFWQNQKKAAINIINLNLGKQIKGFAGVSGLTYVPSKDLLLFTASTENTSSSYGDGEITDSYLGWITNFSTKTKLKEVTADGMINLADNNQSFNKQKIESVALQDVQDKALILHFVADNDNGQTTLFRARFTL